MPRKKACCVVGCNENWELLKQGQGLQRRFNRMPVNDEVLKKWSSILNMQIKSSYICSLHFRADDFHENGKRKSFVLPLPMPSGEILEPSNELLALDCSNAIFPSSEIETDECIDFHENGKRKSFVLPLPIPSGEILEPSNELLALDCFNEIFPSTEGETDECIVPLTYNNTKALRGSICDRYSLEQVHVPKEHNYCAAYPVPVIKEACSASPVNVPGGHNYCAAYHDAKDAPCSAPHTSGSPPPVVEDHNYSRASSAPEISVSGFSTLPPSVEDDKDSQEPAVTPKAPKQPSGSKPRAKRELKFDSFGYSRHDITPRKRGLMKTLRNVRFRLDQARAKSGKKLANESHALELQDGLKSGKPLLKLLVQSHLKNSKKTHGVRYSAQEKKISTALYKKFGSTVHKFLREEIAPLPSPRVVQRLLEKVPLSSVGVAPVLKRILSKMAKAMKAKDKMISLVFDEVQLMPTVSYMPNAGKLAGLVDLGDGVRPEAATHALVFMAVTICRKIILPVAYFFVHKLTGEEVASLTKKVAGDMVDCGFEVVSAVCDMAQINCKAIAALIREGRPDGPHGAIGGSFSVNGSNTYPLFDAIHLLKNSRNILLTHDVEFGPPGSRQTAKWEHIEKLYYINNQVLKDSRLCPKLTEGHIFIKDKMKVKLAAQVLSHTVSAALRCLVSDGLLPAEALGTAEYVLKIDRLIDSVNGSAVNPVDGKVFRRAVKLGSPHWKEWEDGIEFFKSMTFTAKAGRKAGVTEESRALNRGWIHTLTQIRAMCLSVFQRHADVDFLCMRRFQQDYLENFFGRLRRFHRKLTPNLFIQNYKGLLVADLDRKKMGNFNCEDDDSEFMPGVGELLKNLPTFKEVQDNVAPQARRARRWSGKGLPRPPLADPGSPIPKGFMVSSPIPALDLSPPIPEASPVPKGFMVSSPIPALDLSPPIPIASPVQSTTSAISELGRGTVPPADATSSLAATIAALAARLHGPPTPQPADNDVSESLSVGSEAYGDGAETVINDALLELPREQATAYISGFCARKIVRSKQVQNCPQCVSSLLTNQPCAENLFIALKEYRVTCNSLLYPSVRFRSCANDIVTVLNIPHESEKTIPKSFARADFGRSKIQVLRKEVNFTWFRCDTHRMFVVDEICKCFLRTLMGAWAKRLTRALRSETYYIRQNIATAVKRKCRKDVGIDPKRQKLGW